MKRFILTAVVSALFSAGLAGCASGPLKQVQLPANSPSTLAKAQAHVKKEELAWRQPAIVTEGTPSVVLYRPQSLPAKLGDRHVDLQMAPGVTVQDLAAILSTKMGVPFIIGDKKASEASFYLPQYSGTLSQLLQAISSSTNVWFVWKDGSVQVRSTAPLGITIPQEKELAKTIESGLKSIGVKNSFVDWYSGLATVDATPEQFNEVEAYLQRMTNNAAVINLQVVVIGVSFNQSSASGINWNGLQVAALTGGGPTAFNNGKTVYNGMFGGSSSGSSTSYSSGGIPGISGGTASTGTGSTGTSTTSTGTSSTATGTTTTTSTAGTATGSSATSGSANLPTLANAVGGLLGTGSGLTAAFFSQRFSLTGMVDFLENYGTTTTNQNLMLKTVGGNEVKFKSVTQIPYVSGVTVSGTTSGGSTSNLGGTSTSTASDGIEVKMTPTFDDDTQTVTVKMNLSIKAVVAFNQLSAGNQIGSLTQPTTADHSFNDVLKLRPGQTVVVGGMTYDNIADNRGLPLFLNANSSLAHKSLTVNKQTMFIVVRPTVVRMGSLKVREEAHP